jgi:hypothetical protein
MEPIPPNTAAIKHFVPGREPTRGYTEGRGVKYRMEPVAARKQPMMNVK